jgi:glycosyltransferase involved in cell wall biosynthesis
LARVDWLITEMNILGGAEMFVRLAAPRMREHGWDLRVITILGGGVLIDKLRFESVPVVELGLGQVKIATGINLIRVLTKDKPRLLHTHLYHAGLVGRVVGRIAGIHPIIVHQAGPEQRRTSLRTCLDRNTSWLVDQYLVPCNSVKRVLQTREHISTEKITVIPYGIETELFHHKTRLPETWPADLQVPIVGTVGRLAPEKGHSLLLDALANLLQRGKPFHAIIVGDGILKNELIERTKTLHLENHISWVGNQTNITEWLSLFDVFVLSSHWEGTSLALLEAMDAGLPVVATDVGGNPDIVEDGRTGILVTPGNPQQLANAIDRLIDNPLLRQQMGRAGQIRCRENFDIDKIVDRLDTLYKKLLS